MRILDIIGCETPWGLKTIEVRHGDITTMPCDVLAISAFYNDYYPALGTVIHSLQYNLGINVNFLNKEAFLDLRKNFCLWISKPIINQPFKYILCVENMGEDDALDNMTNDVFFSIGFLEAKKIMVQSIAMPLIGTGVMGESIDNILPNLIKRAKNILGKHEHLKQVLFVEYNEKKAEIIRDKLREDVGESYAIAMVNNLTQQIKESVYEDVLKLSDILPEQLTGELLRVCQDTIPSFIEIGVLSRKLAELVAEKVVKDDRANLTLYDKINMLSKRNMAPWLVCYLHALRIMGNEVVHIRETRDQTPGKMSEKDLAICLLCIQSTLGYIAENKQAFYC